MSEHHIKTLGNTEARLLLTLASQGKQVFTTDEAQAAIGGARHQVNKLLSRLNDKRWVLRLQRGLYLILPFEAGVEGAYSVHPFLIVPHLAMPYALAYWTALSHYNYTEQIPGTIFVATPIEPTSSELTIEELGLQYRFVTLVSHKFFAHRRVWIEGQGVTITDWAKTVVDCLDHPEYCGGIIEAAKGLYGFIKEQVPALYPIFSSKSASMREVTFRKSFRLPMMRCRSRSRGCGYVGKSLPFASCPHIHQPSSMEAKSG